MYIYMYILRGGATWHFAKYVSHDATTELGRWGSVEVALTYIDQALAQTHYLRVPQEGKHRLEKALDVFPSLLEEAIRLGLQLKPQ